MHSMQITKLDSKMADMVNIQRLFFLLPPILPICPILIINLVTRKHQISTYQN